MSIRFVRYLCIILISVPMASFGHGGVDNVGNQCRMTIGPYKMLFTGYQPVLSSKEFCDDIPEPGNTFVVLDHVDKSLRKMPTDYRIMEDTQELGIDATLADLGTKAQIEKDTVYYVAPKLYPTGTMVINREFKKGRYIGMVTVNDLDRNVIHTSVFPFSVGYGEPMFELGVKGLGYTLFLVLLVLVLVVVLLHGAKKKQSKQTL